MIDPDHRQSMAEDAAKKRAAGELVVTEMRSMVVEKQAELNQLKVMANTMAKRFGLAVPFADIEAFTSHPPGVR